jgi:hypothetical protein
MLATAAVAVKVLTSMASAAPASTATLEPTAMVAASMPSVVLAKLVVLATLVPPAATTLAALAAVANQEMMGPPASTRLAAMK